MENTRAKQNIVFCLLILLSNVMAFVLITASPKLRRFSKFHITTSMSVANIVASLAFFPLDIHEALGLDKPNLDPKVRILITGIHLYCMPSVLAISIVCLGIDYMVNRIYNTSLQRKIFTSAVSILVPWSFGLLCLVFFSCTDHLVVADSRNILVGIKATHVYNGFNNTYNNGRAAIMEMDIHNYECNTPMLIMVITQMLLWGLMPLILAFIVIVTSVLLHQMYKAVLNHASISHSSVSPVDSEEEFVIEIRLLDTTMSMVVSAVLSIPFLVEVLSSIRCTPTGQCFMSEPVSRSMELARWSVSFILPVLWMLDSEFRKAIAVMCDKLS